MCFFCHLINHRPFERGCPRLGGAPNAAATIALHIFNRNGKRCSKNSSHLKARRCCFPGRPPIAKSGKYGDSLCSLFALFCEWQEGCCQEGSYTRDAALWPCGGAGGFLRRLSPTTRSFALAARTLRLLRTHHSVVKKSVLTVRTALPPAAVRVRRVAFRRVVPPATCRAAPW